MKLHVIGRPMAGGRVVAGKMVALVLTLVLVLATAGCSGQVEEIREQTLADVGVALVAGYELAGGADSSGPVQEGLQDVLPELDRASSILGDCTGRTEDCLAQSLSYLLDADRALVSMTELDDANAVEDLTSLMAPVRSAATRLYEHFYGTESSSQGNDWRGRPTPRPPGVCPGG